jgi:serine/threonine-protein kinase
MAEVFRAVAHGVEGFQRVFVVKRILKEKSEAKEFIEMFVNEARISALLHHPNIVQIYDFGQIEGSYFLSMEYLHGKDLLSVLRTLRQKGRMLPPELAGYIAQQVAAGLGYAHSLTQGGGRSLHIVHRDVSPSNVMLLRAGGVKLLDFGIAKAATEIRNANTTQAGLVKGKLSYLSPEQVRGEAIDGRSDVFSLGVVLWECLTGKRLFFDKTDYNTMQNVVERPIPPPSTQRAEVPAALDYIVIRALERDLDRRYPSAKLMAEDLEGYLQETRFAPGALPRLLDDLFGPEEPVAETQVPPLPSSSMEVNFALEPDTPAHPRPPEEGVSRSLSGNNVPPVSISRVEARVRSDSKTFVLLRRRRREIVAAGVCAALGLVLVGRQLVTRPAPPTASVAPPPVSAGPPRAVQMAPPPAAAERREVTVKIESDPSGAEVKGQDGETIGLTPLSFAIPRSDAPTTLTVAKTGFLPVHQAIVPDRDLASLITLRAQPTARPAAKPSARGAPPRPRARVAVPAPRRDGKVREGLSIDPFADEAKRR